MDVTVIGNVATDPDLKVTDNGKQLLSFRIAENRARHVNGEWHHDASFYTIEVWEHLADHTHRTITKGDRIVVVGVLKQDTWTTTDNQPRSRYLITARDIAASLRFATCHITRERPDTDAPTPQPAPTGPDPEPAH